MGSAVAADVLAVPEVGLGVEGMADQAEHPQARRGDPVGRDRVRIHCRGWDPVRPDRMTRLFAKLFATSGLLPAMPHGRPPPPHSHWLPETARTAALPFPGRLPAFGNAGTQKTSGMGTGTGGLLRRRHAT